MAGRTRNPTWQRDELILALDLYIRLGRQVVDETHPEVIKLSKILGELPIHPPEQRTEPDKFRNPNGVGLKLANFRYRDPDNPGGMAGGGAGEVPVWEEFAHDTARLRSVAQAIIDGHLAPAAEAPAVVDEDEEAFPEGRVLYRMHRSRERNRKVVEEAKRKALRQHGHLSCAVCDFDFRETYGALGEDFIEAHHVRPVSELAEGQTTRPSDLVLVCANCHRMLHRRRPWLTVADLKAVIAVTAK